MIYPFFMWLYLDLYSKFWYRIETDYIESETKKINLLLQSSKGHIEIVEATRISDFDQVLSKFHDKKFFFYFQR